MSSGPLFTPGASIASRPVIQQSPGVDGGSPLVPTPHHAARANPRTFIQVLSEGQRPEATAPPAALSAKVPGASVRGHAASAFPELKVLAERALDAEKRVEALLASAGQGKTFSASELIALQATVFRYSQTVEVLSRATDRLVGALKQTLGTQV